MKKRNVYKENGYENRKAYLDELADMHGVDKGTVYMLANMLGSNEDFDGLVNRVEDYSLGYY
jgi:hypothetical protein